MRRIEPKAETVDVEALKKQVWEMPYLDRISILSLSVIAREGEALASCYGLVALLAKMSTGCGAANRIAIAERLRNAADHIDHELATATIPVGGS